MVWKQVAPVGNLSYVTASFVTYMAVQMLKQMEYTLVTDFPFLDHPYARLYNTILSFDIGSADTHLLGSQGLVSDFKQFCKKGKTRTVTWALVFACQMQANSIQARRRYLDYDLQAMRNLGDAVLQDYHHYQTGGIFYGENMSKVAKLFVEYAATTIENWVSEDLVTAMKLRHDWDKLKQATHKDSLWLQNPWLTANVISEITLDYFQARVSVASAGGFVQSAIQLWNMLRQMGYLPPPLHDSAIVGDDSNTTKEYVLLLGFLKHWEPYDGHQSGRVRSRETTIQETADKPPRQRYHESGRGMLANISELVLIH